MKLLSAYDRLVRWTIGLSIVAFAAADEQPLLLVLAAAVFIGTAVLRGRGAGGEAGAWPMLPTPVVNALVLAAIVYAAVKTTILGGGEPVVSTLGQFLVLILLVKLLDRRSSRDDSQLLTLSVFVLIAAVLTSNSLVVGVVLVVASLLGLGAAMLWQVRAGQAAAMGPGGWGELMRASAPEPAQGARARRSFRRLWAGVGVACCAVAMVVFVLTPRGLGADALGRFGAPRETMIGYRDDIRLGQAGLLSDNPTPVMDVKIVEGDLGVGAVGTGMLYLRGGVSDAYDRATASWIDSEPPAGNVPVQAFNRWTLAPRSDRGRGEGRAIGKRALTITQRVSTQAGTIFTLWRPLSILSEKPFKGMRSGPHLTVRRQETSVPFSYTVESQAAEEPGPPPRFAPEFADGPVRGLAEGLLRDARLDDTGRRGGRAAVNTLREHLRGAAFSYSLEMVAPPSGVDPIDHFLLESKRGHCEYFASALAAMCQAVGIPARVVAGYLTTEFNPLTGQYLVRESNAHAWVEAFIVTDTETGYGRWETFEASPPGDIERIHSPRTGVLARVRGWYEAMEFGWTNSIVGFDAFRQGRLLGRSNEQAGQSVSRFNMMAERLVTWLRTRDARPRGAGGPAAEDEESGWTTTVVAAGALAAAGVVVWIWWSRRRRGAGPMDGELAELLKQAAFYPASLEALRRVGKGKPESSSPLTHARAIGRTDAALGEAFAELSGLYYRVRYGRRALSAGESVRARELLSHVRSQVSPRASR